MFRRQYKKNQIIYEKVDGDQHLEKYGLDERVAGSEAPAAGTSIGNNWSTFWLHRLFGYRLNKDKGSSKSENKPTEQQQRVASLDGAATTTAHPPEKKKPQKRKNSFWRLFNCFRRKTRVSPLSDDDTQDHQRSSLQIEPEIQQQGGNRQEDTAVIKNCQEGLTNVKRIQVHPIYSGHSFFLGFPNPSMICYMNASLQSLLTLKEFVEDIRSQAEVLALCPEAQLMRCFLDIVRYRSSADARLKLEAVMRFKRVLSVQAPEFEHGGMKDAHEFITAVLDQIRNLVIPLTETAASMGSSYSCPVQRHLLFKMQNTRTCKGCGVQSRREEDFTMLSLDLIPGGSVQDMLHINQMERVLEFRCQCGGNTSGLESRLLALPKYLILHLKRFKFTENLVMVKLEDPIILCREMTVTAHQGDQLYSLISVISHVGSSVRKGHYVSDGLHPDHTLEDGEDRWLHFNDIYVLETSGAMVSEWSTEDSYVLVYQRRAWPALV